MRQPSVEHQAISVDEDSAYSFTPTGGDVDTGTTLVYSITNQPSWATFSTETGELAGTPDKDEIGINEAIQISVTDGIVTENMAVFSITVNEVNDAPIISGTPAASVDEDSGYSFIPTATDEEGNSLTYSIANEPSWISFDSSDGSMVGTPNNSDVGSDEDITISVSDGTSTVSLATFNITIINTNDAPVIGGTLSSSATEDDGVITSNASVVDVDTGSSATYSIIGSESGTYGDISIDLNSGLWTYTMISSIHSLDVDDEVSDSFDVQVEDDQGATDNGVILVTINGVNDIPEISGGLTQSGTEEDSTVSGTISVIDVDDLATKNFNISDLDGIYGNISIDADTGTWIYTLEDDVNELSVGETISDDFIVEVTDNEGATETDTITVEINGVNDTPSISGTPNLNIDEDSAYSFSATVVEIDAGDTLTYSIVNMPSWATLNATTGELSGTPENDDVGAHTGIVISVNDGTETVSLASFDIAVANTNDAPTISGDAVTSVNEDSAYSFTAVGSDVDAGDIISYSITNMPSWATFNVTTGELSGTPDNDDVNTYENIEISVTDEPSETATLEAFNIEVINTNDAPVISGVAGTSIDEDSAYSFVPTASDVDTGDALTYSITEMPSWATFNATTGELSGTPENDDVGNHTGIIISVNDGTETVSLASFDIAVANTNDAPTISGDAVTSVNEDSAYSFTAVGSDVDAGDSITYSITNMPSWATFNATTGELSGTPDNDDVNTYENIEISVADQSSETATLAAFDIEVVNTNDAPVISGTAGTSIDEDSGYSFIPIASDVDTGDALRYVIENMPGWASFNTSTGELSGTPENDDVGNHDGIVIGVSDETVTVNLASFDIEVVNTNDAPTIGGTPAISVDEDIAERMLGKLGSV